MSDLKDILSKLKKQGLNVVVSNEQDKVIERITSGSIGLDRILGGGYPRGRITEIYGEPSCGKSIMAYLAIAEVQKNGGIAALVDVEMNITLLKVWRVRFPDFYVRVFCFNHLPYFLPNSTTVAIRIDVE